jgi:hypothetical protein
VYKPEWFAVVDFIPRMTSPNGTKRVVVSEKDVVFGRAAVAAVAFDNNLPAGWAEMYSFSGGRDGLWRFASVSGFAGNGFAVLAVRGAVDATGSAVS